MNTASHNLLEEDITELLSDVMCLTRRVEQALRGVADPRAAIPLRRESSLSQTADLITSSEATERVRHLDLTRRPRAPLPDPRLIDRILRQRRLRDRYFESELFADPAWDILLDLTVARARHRRVSVTSLCVASAVPHTTALRWISQMVAMGILVRVQDDEDKRRVFIVLSDSAAESMARYFDELGTDATRLV